MAVNRQMSFGNSVLPELQKMLAPKIDHQMYSHYGHSENLLEGMRECYEERKFCDVTLVVGNKKIEAHKIVLSSFSDYFKGLIDYRWSNKIHDEIIIEDFDEETLKAVLNFAYTGRVDVNRENVLKLLTAGDFLQLDFVKESCAVFLQSSVNTENCLLMLATACKFNVADLEDFILEFIGNNYYGISRHEHFQDLPSELLAKLLRSETLIVDKEQAFLPAVLEQELYVLESVLKYISHQPENIRDEISFELLQSIRLLLLPTLRLEKLLKDELVSGSVETKRLVTKAVDAKATITDCNASTAKREDSANLPDIFSKKREATKARARWYKIHFPHHIGQRRLWFDDYELASGDGTYLNGMKVWSSSAHDAYMYICGIQLFYSNGATSVYGTHDTDDVEEFHLEEGERIVKATVGSAWALTFFTFDTSKGRKLGPLGDNSWGHDVFTEESGPYGFLAYMRGSVADANDGKLRIVKFSLMWREFALNGPYADDEIEEHGEVESLYYDSDSAYVLNPELLEGADDLFHDLHGGVDRDDRDDDPDDDRIGNRDAVPGENRIDNYDRDDNYDDNHDGDRDAVPGDDRADDRDAIPDDHRDNNRDAVPDES